MPAMEGQSTWNVCSICVRSAKALAPSRIVAPDRLNVGSDRASLQRRTIARPVGSDRRLDKVDARFYSRLGLLKSMHLGCKRFE